MIGWRGISGGGKTRKFVELKVVLVCHCYRDEGNVIRIISARKASIYESKQYR
ncbi:hypothetical protein C5F52_17410 [Limnohabitans sp. TS-CS-82]|nr:hypothetical protein C5F52_17410 [Limnohabitans sp. TS-CS-82]